VFRHPANTMADPRVFEIHGAIKPPYEYPWMFGLNVIMTIATMYSHCSRDGIGFIDVPGTNYCVYISGASPILYYVITTPDGSKKRVIGTIMTTGYKIPDLATWIVWQQCRGIYGTGKWDKMRKQLLTATNRDMTCAEFAKNVSDVLNKYIGYVSTASEMNPTTQSPSEIIDELTRLFYMETPEHATNHMKEILKLMDQLNMANQII